MVPEIGTSKMKSTSSTSRWQRHWLTFMIWGNTSQGEIDQVLVSVRSLTYGSLATIYICTISRNVSKYLLSLWYWSQSYLKLYGLLTALPWDFLLLTSYYYPLNMWCAPQIQLCHIWTGIVNKYKWLNWHIYTVLISCGSK